MNILIISYLPLWPLSGGSSLRVYRYVKEFCNKGHNVSVICPLEVSEEEVKKEVGNIRVYPFRLFKINRFVKFREIKYSFFSLVAIPSVFKIIKTDKIDLIITHNAVPALPAILAKKFKKISYILDIVDFMTGYMAHENKILNVISKISLFLEIKMIISADKIIAITDNLKDVLEKKGFKKEVVIIPDGVDLDIFNIKKYNFKEIKEKHNLNGKILIFMGIMDTYQGVDLILETMSEVVKKYPNTKLLLLGKGPQLDYYKSLVKQKNLSRNIIFTGWISEDLPKYVAAADIGLVLHPKGFSNETMFPIKLLQYWAMEKPILSSDLPQIRKVVKNGESGYLFKPSDKNDFLEKLFLLLKSKNLNKMGKNGRKIVEKYYDWDKLSYNFVKECEKFKGDI